MNSMATWLATLTVVLVAAAALDKRGARPNRTS
jgi:hypothetical protein